MEWLAGVFAGAGVVGVIVIVCCLGLPLALGVFAATRGKEAGRPGKDDISGNRAPESERRV